MRRTGNRSLPPAIGMNVGDTENGLRACAAALPDIAYAATPPAASADAPRRSCRRLLDFMLTSWFFRRLSSATLGARLGARHHSRNRRRRRPLDLRYLNRLPGLCVAPAETSSSTLAFRHDLASRK